MNPRTVCLCQPMVFIISEIVVPLMRGPQLLGVLDLDSPVLSRFDAQDQAGLEAVAALLVAGSDIPGG